MKDLRMCSGPDKFHRTEQIQFQTSGQPLQYKLEVRYSIDWSSVDEWYGAYLEICAVSHKVLSRAQRRLTVKGRIPHSELRKYIRFSLSKPSFRPLKMKSLDISANAYPYLK